MTTNPLVAGPVDTSSALGGTMLLESLYDLSRAIESEDWLAAGLSGLSTVLDTAAAVMDPLGQLIAAGLGWLMEHVEPLKGWLNDLTGDAGAVLGFAGTWDNIAAQMGTAAGDLDHLVAADLEGMRGQGIEAYARYASDFAEHMRAIGGSSTAVANSLRTCSTIVQVVHDLVRDALAELVGAAISWAAQIVFTVGLGTPWVISQVATRVSSLAARVGSKVTGVITSARALGELIDALKAAIRSLGDNLRSARPGSGRGGNGGGGGGGSGGHGGGGNGGGDGPGGKGPDDDGPGSHGPDGEGTQPSGTPDPDATPGGRTTPIGPKEDPDTRRSLERENESAQALARQGYDVEQNPQVPGAKNPDYRIEGRIFDNVAPSTSNARNIWSRVEEKVLAGQTSRVVLNLDDSGVDLARLRTQFEYPIEGLEEVIVIRGGEIIHLFP